MEQWNGNRNSERTQLQLSCVTELPNVSQVLLYYAMKRLYEKVKGCLHASIYPSTALLSAHQMLRYYSLAKSDYHTKAGFWLHKTIAIECHCGQKCDAEIEMLSVTNLIWKITCRHMVL